MLEWETDRDVGMGTGLDVGMGTVCGVEMGTVCGVGMGTHVVLECAHVHYWYNTNSENHYNLQHSSCSSEANK